MVLSKDVDGLVLRKIMQDHANIDHLLFDQFVAEFLHMGLVGVDQVDELQRMQMQCYRVCLNVLLQEHWGVLGREEKAAHKQCKVVGFIMNDSGFRYLKSLMYIHLLIANSKFLSKCDNF